jgi:hypothetical protein
MWRANAGIGTLASIQVALLPVVRPGPVLRQAKGQSTTQLALSHALEPRT